VIELLPRRCEALGSISSTKKEKKERKKKKRKKSPESSPRYFDLANLDGDPEIWILTSEYSVP
jgi:hypothetical protein